MFSVVVLRFILTISATAVANDQLMEVFRDDFEGGVLNQTTWNVVNKASMVNEELQFYTPNAVSISGTEKTNNYSAVRTVGK